MLIAGLLLALPTPEPPEPTDPILVRFLDAAPWSAELVRAHHRQCLMDEPAPRLEPADHVLLEGADGEAWYYHGLPIAQYRIDLDGDGVRDILGLIESRACFAGKTILAVSLTEDGQLRDALEVAGSLGVVGTVEDGLVVLSGLWRMPMEPWISEEPQVFGRVDELIREP